ncbi:histone-lysine N-methyltransferase SETMAR [Trichonephila clavipes]|nr:histone-lysine N-methyltransferase SETMAR [Trichonephila clavipes]
MRVENHSHIRHIMLNHFEKGWKAAQSFGDPNELFGKGTISESSSGSRGRGREPDNKNAGRRLQCLNPRLFVASKSLENHWMCPHDLSDNNRADRVRIFPESLQRNEQTPFLKNLVTGDESWLPFKNVKRKVCVSPGVSSKGIPKHVHCKNAMWWDRSARGIDCLPSKWEAVIEVDGNYAPE